MEEWCGDKGEKKEKEKERKSEAWRGDKGEIQEWGQVGFNVFQA